ncbi:MAG: acetate--CoA ligase, partial [Candidatus Aenigmarchaeota archaeon]|nr:acetate--CoA ligase [Candidatus Aenigmarchaeota archaeon]
RISYSELTNRVSRCANLFRKLGVRKGDVVAIYMPLIPEAIISMLACARIGAVHSVVFSAFSAEALKTRLLDGRAKLLVTADGYYRRGKPEDLMAKVSEAVKGTLVRKIVLVSRLGKPKPAGRMYVSWQETEKQDSRCRPRAVESNDMLFILYTSGTTGKPKGVVHDSGGYITQAHWTTKWDFNLRDDDTIWCTADVGWITGHTYACYGPLSLGVTTLIYEGAPDFPDMGRWWKIIQDNKVTVLYTAPTAIRMFIKSGDEWLRKYNLASLKILGTVGEPIDEESWLWYLGKVGGGRCPVIDTWWQTETGGTLINALPGIGPFIPTVAGRSFPGTRHVVLDEKGRKAKAGENGYLVQLSPFAPGMLRGVYKNHEKYVETYWKNYKGKYYTSDGAFTDRKGFIRLTGRVDDVMKVAGHRLSTAEMENAIDRTANVDESAVVPAADQIKGQVPVAFVVLKKGIPSPELEKRIVKSVEKAIGPIARPARIYFVEDLPKTRSGKIIRRVLKALLNSEPPGDLMTLTNPESVEKIKKTIGK